MESYKHVVEIDESVRKLVIYRSYSNGKSELYTSVDLPPKTIKQDPGMFEEFARTLGENILLDAPAARRILAL